MLIVSLIPKFQYKLLLDLFIVSSEKNYEIKTNEAIFVVFFSYGNWQEDRKNSQSL